ncbi:MAG: URC4/urg3 family protein [Tatlockia sp.]|nr:URC4/urg3 family protein [Tatlockia sp.]
MNKDDLVLESLQNLKTIRLQSQRILSLARKDKSAYFRINEERIPATLNFILEVIYSQYPTLEIPYHSRWRHFEAGGVDRIQQLIGTLYGLSSEELGKILYELVIISVFLDAGAGNRWHYQELSTGQFYCRSEGLALASLDLYLSGALSADRNQPLRIDAEVLLHFSKESLLKAFQINQQNPLEGVEGRVALLNRLGKVLKNKTEFFTKEGRLGNFYSKVLTMQNEGVIDLTHIFASVLNCFREIWPERLRYKGINLGDVWVYPPLISEAQPGSELVPFHKLSQWLSYSLIEPLELAGFHLTNLAELTGLPEYRNGGLLVDMGVLEAKNPQILQDLQDPASELIVEWRALTVALLDELADALRHQLKMNEKELPLAKILQGGTWEAGRRIAKQKRPDGRPPIQIVSDGTIF